MILEVKELLKIKIHDVSNEVASFSSYILKLLAE